MFQKENFQQKLKNTAAVTNLFKRCVEAAVIASIVLFLVFGGVFVGEGAPIPLIYRREELPPEPEWDGRWLEVQNMGPRFVDFSREEAPVESGPPREIFVHIPTYIRQRELERLAGERINSYRASWDMEPLNLDHERLNEVARFRAYEISQHFSRNRPDGTPGLVIFPAFNAASENISRGPVSAHGLLNSWMVSPNHREAIFDYHALGFNAVGIGLFVDEYGEYFWVAAFINERTEEQGEIAQEELERWWEENFPGEEFPEEWDDIVTVW